MADELKPLEMRFQPTYGSGDPIEITGVYRVLHERHHTMIRDVVVVKGGFFPKCRHCKPTFMLMHRYSQLSDLFPKS